MKTSKLFTILFLLSSSFIKAQQYYPFIEESKTWSEIHSYMAYVPPYPVFISTKSFKLEGDTVWNGKTYKNLYTCDTDPSVSNWEIGSDYLYREEAGKVFKVNLWSVQEELVYDFNLDVGDSVYVDSIYANAYAHVTRVDSILIDEAYHKQIHFDSPQDIWVEGLGSLHSPFNPIQYSFVIPGWSELLCVTNQNGTIYMNPSYLKCYIDTTYFTSQPELFQRSGEIKVSSNPMNAFSLIEIQNSALKFEKYSLFNSGGMMIRSEPIRDKTFIIMRENLPSGIYFLKVYSKEIILSKKIIIN